MGSVNGVDALLKDLVNGIDELKATIQDATSKNVSKATISNVVELAILRTYSLTETFIHEIFYLCLLGDGGVPGNGARIALGSRDEADLVMLSSGSRQDKFISWLPLPRTLDLADRYLNEGHPFERLRYRDVEIRSARELTTVRNAIAHPSEHAWVQFRELASQRGYPALRAADYLLSLRSGQPESLLLMTTAELICRSLLASNDYEVDRLLNPEMAFAGDAKVPPGRYECARCGAERTVAATSRLGACSSCEVVETCTTCGNTPKPRSSWRRMFRQD